MTALRATGGLVLLLLGIRIGAAVFNLEVHWPVNSEEWQAWLSLGVAYGTLALAVVTARSVQEIRANELERYGREGGDLLKALVTELEENITALGDGEQLPDPIARSTWDVARKIGVSDETRRLLTDAYIAGGRVNRAISVIDAERLALGSDSTTMAIRARDMKADALRLSNAARNAFVRARDALLAEIDRVARHST